MVFGACIGVCPPISVLLCVCACMQAAEGTQVVDTRPIEQQSVYRRRRHHAAGRLCVRVCGCGCRPGKMKEPWKKFGLGQHLGSTHGSRQCEKGSCRSKHAGSGEEAEWVVIVQSRALLNFGNIIAYSPQAA
eukprot:scaffold112929_cov22-Tisochrysis_lutea.AAC.1